MADLFDQLRARIISRCTRNTKTPHCLLLTVAFDKNEYGIVSVVWPDGKRQHMRVHRAAFMAYHHLLPGQIVNKTLTRQQLDVSHRGHTPTCVESTHLTLEEHAVNNDRKVCNLQGSCFQGHVPHCLC